MWLKPLFAEEEGDWDNSLASRITLLLTGAILIRLGFRIWVGVEPRVWIDIIAVQVLFLVAIECVLIAASDLDMNRWGRWIAGSILVAIVLTVLAVMPRAWTRLATDAMMFSKYAGLLVLEGTNPYTASMQPATELDGAGLQWSTAQIDASYVWSFSYPAGGFLAYLPATIVGIPIRTVSVLAAGGVAGLLILDSPPELALGGLLAVILPRNLIVTAAGGLTDMLWVLPVVVAMRCWYRDRWTLAAITLGGAASIKQQPWVSLPFLGVWLWDRYPLREFLYHGGRCVMAGGATFLLVNLPWIVADPTAWLNGVFTPVGSGAALVQQGVGLALWSSSVVYPLSLAWHTTAVVIVTGCSLVTYAVYIDRLRWIAWVVPIVVFFVHSRSLMSYFTHFVPIGYYAVLATRDRIVLAGPSLAAVAQSRVGGMHH